MTVWEWIVVGVSTVVATSVLVSLLVSKILAEIGDCAEAVMHESWASAPLTRAERSVERPAVPRAS
jgi:hypothetical protein